MLEQIMLTNVLYTSFRYTLREILGVEGLKRDENLIIYHMLLILVKSILKFGCVRKSLKHSTESERDNSR